MTFGIGMDIGVKERGAGAVGDQIAVGAGMRQNPALVIIRTVEDRPSLRGKNDRWLAMADKSGTIFPAARLA
ncbi:MAG: hypothetical protein J0G37_10250 [Afipia sp.]|nr:hypothetical protein [Afipia sp.]